MTTFVKLPERIEEALSERVESGEYSSKSDFVKEAVRTHMDKVLLAPDPVSERSEVREEGATTVDWERVREDM